MAMASAYAQVPQDSLEVRNDTLRVLVADSAEQTLPLYLSQNIIYNIPVAECV